ncbi:MAG: hypothetical protein J7M30_06225 [Deltaproteobacteria bacterium]|nr:hypothetical protein [Deltaproteobacteria bacterium]
MLVQTQRNAPDTAIRQWHIADRKLEYQIFNARNGIMDEIGTNLNYDLPNDFDKNKTVRYG